jgi:N-acetylglucosamine-6-phosphate deacetylase
MTSVIDCPGFLDLQVNGFAGVDFNDPASTDEDLGRAFQSMRATGVTQCLPTLITSSFGQFASCARRLARLPSRIVAGLHMEGPYISPADGARGAHPREYVVRADVDDFERRMDAADGRIVLVTLAPEAPGALALTERLAARGIRVAIGHTAATPSQIRDGIAAGASMSTHLGNGCPAVLPRHPNLLWEELAADALFASLIVDGHHLPDSTVKVMIRAKTPARTLLVTDAVAPAGCAPGVYFISGMRIRLDSSGRVMKEGETMLAGSALTLDRAVANTVRYTGLALEAVLPMAADQPAAYLGIPCRGRLRAAWDAEACTLRVISIDDDA